MSCRLCQSRNGLEPVVGADERSYFLCNNCRLISAAPEHFPGRQEEKARYLSHKNGLQHEGYVKFLHRAVDPASAFLRTGMTGLDYGCGHAPTLSVLLEAEGYACEDYDPLFVGHSLTETFDFIFSTEVFEHFPHPGREIEKIRSLLNANGLLIVMTERWKDLKQFSEWYYTRDSTHVCFYHSGTFEFICSTFGFEKIFDDGNRVVILRKLVL